AFNYSVDPIAFGERSRVCGIGALDVGKVEFAFLREYPLACHRGHVLIELTDLERLILEEAVKVSELLKPTVDLGVVFVALVDWAPLGIDDDNGREFAVEPLEEFIRKEI